MHRTLGPAIACALVPLLGSSCGGGHEHDHDGGHGHAHASEGAHGGTLATLGNHAAHLELLHDGDAGSLSVYVLDAEGSRPVVPDAPPLLKLSGEAGPIEVAGTVLDDPADGSGFRYEHEGLVGDPAGRVSVRIGGKEFHADLGAEHGH